jgi:hypothetical protein
MFFFKNVLIVLQSPGPMTCATRVPLVVASGVDQRPTCYGPQPYAHLASICQSIRVCVSLILVPFEPATFVYLFS